MKPIKVARELKAMVRRFVQGRSSEAERAFLSRWDEHFEKRSAPEQIPADEMPEIESRVFQQIKQEIAADSRRVRWLSRPAKYVAAAVLILLAAGGLTWFYTLNDSALPQPDLWVESANDFAPGGSRAFITTDDGEIIPLDDSQRGIVVSEGILYADGSPLHADLADNWVHLITPIGGTFQVTLADGTNVWLNAGTKLTYPQRFENGVRKVRLEGEAYFEVAKQPQPFLVETRSQTVEVLGTQFNIAAYADEQTVTTTLVEGSVQIAREHHAAEVLAPGQQAVLTGSTLNIHNVETASYIAWKDNLFVFDHASLQTVLKELQRWYGFDFESDNLPNLHFKGGIDRHVPLSEVLTMLEATTSEIHFIIDNKQVIVMQGKRK